MGNKWVNYFVTLMSYHPGKMTYLSPLIDALQEAADPKDALQMKEYMMDRFEFFGIRMKPRREICRAFVKENGLPEFRDLEEVVKECFIAPQRELHYFGQELPARFKRYWDEDIINLFEWMILNKSWWDSVDFIATHLVGEYFKKFPQNTVEITTVWINQDHFWLQRAAILFQLRYKEETDVDLLFSHILKHTHQKDFFIRKAIGWALRDLSKTMPDQVRKFVTENEMQPLSKKEALRKIQD